MFMVSFWPREVTPPHAGLVETLLASPELASLYLSGLSFVRVGQTRRSFIWVGTLDWFQQRLLLYYPKSSRLPQLEELSKLVTKASYRYLNGHVLLDMPNLKKAFSYFARFEGEGHLYDQSRLIADVQGLSTIAAARLLLPVLYLRAP